MKRLRTLFGGTRTIMDPVAGSAVADTYAHDNHGNTQVNTTRPVDSPGSTNKVTTEPEQHGAGGVATSDLVLPDPIFVASEEIARRVLDETGELQRSIGAGAEPTLPIAREIVARVRGIAEYFLRQGGSSTLHSTLIEPVMEMGIHQFAPVFLREPNSRRGIDAKASYDLLKMMFEEYAFLEETGGRPRPGDEVEPLSASLISGLEALGWRRVQEDAPLLERWIDVEPSFVQKIMFGGESGYGVFYAYLSPWESSEVPAWAVDVGGVLLGDTLLLSRRVDDLRGVTADQIDTIAKEMAAAVVPLLQAHVPIGEHQRRFADPGLDPESPEGQAFAAIAQTPLVFGVWGAGQNAEACFEELARLTPDVLKANVIPGGIGFSDDVRTGWAVVSGPAGSAAFGFEIEGGGSQNLIQFGGPDVRPPFQVAMMNFGKTHGAFHAILEGSHLVPMETMPGMALHVRADLADELLLSGWEVTGDDLYFMKQGEAIVFFMVWNENHFGLFSRARETTRVEEPYQLQEVFEHPHLVRLVHRNDPLLKPDRLTEAARDLVGHL